ncbi:MAG TPA: carbonic anhydrase [Candidatus Eisenbacteria bacterium]|nr:carbonic anhydrase [Candidatus Eisenbacteria bacterium]
MLKAMEALARLRQGNRRFVLDQTTTPRFSNATRRAQLLEGQEPFAIILGCSDSRVPAELVFDQGFGDLFVIRVAGNIVAPSQVGSVEFAASRFGTRLVVVMGHTQCGAIIATLDDLRGHARPESRNLRSIIDRVRPSLEPLLTSGQPANEDAFFHQAIRANVRASADHLRHGSELLEELVNKDGLLVVAAEYSLETGEVDFFDGLPL